MEEFKAAEPMEIPIDGPIVFVDVAKEAEQYSLIDDTKPSVEKQGEKRVKIEAQPDPYLTVNPRRVRCTVCHRYTAENEEKMLRHVRKVHRGENPFQCYMCDYTTYNKSLFEEHVRIHQGIKPFKCSHCPYRSVSKKNTKKHELIHRPNNPLKCPDCPFIARNPRVLNSHRKKTHTANSEDSKNYKCTKCEQKFEDYSTFVNHRKSRKRCKICTQLFCQHLLRKHEATEHGIERKKSEKTKRGNFTCQICKWASSSKPRILLHLIHHPNQDLGDCDVDVTVLRQCGILPAA
ncbi:zinc finger protein 525-like [Manduca sexta]|uniref:zinc finger protein 525-like n=1 Tax=Manduca sexta TaxID=7130 RepID=UPI00188E1310|nr:zinc finger protein 525-like [Manduca sexta]